MISLMAVRLAKKKAVVKPARAVEVEMERKEETVLPKWREAGMEEEKLDPAEERMLDNILKGVVIFILGWLGLSVLLVIGGYFGMWK